MLVTQPTPNSEIICAYQTSRQTKQCASLYSEYKHKQHKQMYIDQDRETTLLLLAIIIRQSKEIYRKKKKNKDQAKRKGGLCHIVAHHPTASSLF